MKRFFKQVREAFVPVLFILLLIGLVTSCVSYKHARFKRMYPNATTLDFIIQ